MAIQHVLHRHGGKYRIQAGGPHRQALRQGGKRVGETHRCRSVRAAAPEGIAATLWTREALHFLEHPAAANGTVELARCLANRSLIPLGQHHPLRPGQHRGPIPAAAPQLTTDQPTATPTAVIADVVLVEIRCAGHHDQGAGLHRGIGTTGSLHQGLQRPPRPILQALQLQGPARWNTGQKPQAQDWGGPARPPLLQPEAPLPPTAAEQQQQRRQQRGDVAIAFIRTQAGEQPGRQQVDHQPAPAPAVITSRPGPLSAPEQQAGDSHHQQHNPQLLWQQPRVPQPTLQAQQAGISFTGRGLEHGAVRAPQACDPVVPEPRQDQARCQQRQHQSLSQPGSPAMQGNPGSPDPRRCQRQQGALLHQHCCQRCDGCPNNLSPTSTGPGVTPDGHPPQSQGDHRRQRHFQHVVRPQIQQRRSQGRQQTSQQGQAFTTKP